jgi:transcriptional regulatory protein LevR
VQTLDTEIIKKTYYFLRNNYLTWEKFLNRINADNVIKITAEQFISSPYDTINTISTKFQLDIEPTYHADCLTFEKRYTQDSDVKEKIIDEYGEFIRDLIANDF